MNDVGPRHQTELSAYGPFARTDEAQVLTGLLEDIMAEAAGVSRIFDDFEHVVPDKDRVARARELEKHIYDRGAALDLSLLIEVLYFAGRQGLLRKYSLKFPAYNILDEFFVGSGVPQGPRLQRPVQLPPGRWTLFGRVVDFPIGIPASVLTNNFEWLQYFFGQGFSVLTTRTVRSGYRDANPFPNWVFVPSVSQPFPLGSEVPPVIADPTDWVDAGTTQVSTSNSFGVPTTEPELWMADLRKSVMHLQPGQLLIASVMGEADSQARPGQVTQSLQDDFVKVALMVQSCGVEFVELNLSCPNSLAANDSDGVKPPLCDDLEQSVAVVEAVRAALDRRTRLIVKLSYMDANRLDALLAKIGRIVDGIAGINTIQVRVNTAKGDPTFGERRKAGVSGVAIRNYGLDFVKTLARLRVRYDLDFEILGMGGVTDPASFREMYEAGASVVMSASGAFANPFLAEQCVNTVGTTLGSRLALFDDDEFRTELVGRIRDIVSDGQVDVDELAIRLGLPGDQATSAIRELVGTELEQHSHGRAVTLSR